MALVNRNGREYLVALGAKQFSNTGSGFVAASYMALVNRNGREFLVALGAKQFSDPHFK